MKSTIDKAGRVVIPAPIRERAHLTPGSELEIGLDGADIRITKKVRGPKLVRVGKSRRLIAVPTERRRDHLPPIDIAKYVAEERNRWPL